MRLGLPLQIRPRHLIIGLVLREILAPWTGHTFDFESWARLGFYMQSLGNPYRLLPYVPGVSFSPDPIVGSISYPPLSAFMFALAFRFYLILGEPSRFVYYFILKQPMVLADVGVAIMLARIIKLNGSNALARRAFLIWIYFPLGIIISTLWGQLDPISLFLSLLSIYYFLTSKWVASAMTLGLGIYLKTVPVIFLPVLLLQSQMTAKLRFSLLALSIPALGTFVPATVLNWGYLGAYKNMSYQVITPSHGAMSFLGSLLPPSLPGLITSLTGSVWIVILLASYVYTYRKRLPLFQGLVIVALVFSISRPFLPEQWSLYPLAFLLLIQDRNAIDHFIGLSVAALSFIVASHTLLVEFFSPLSTQAFYWGTLVESQSFYGVLRLVAMGLFALVYFCESILTILGRQSIINRLIMSAAPFSFVRRGISPAALAER